MWPATDKLGGITANEKNGVILIMWSRILA